MLSNTMTVAHNAAYTSYNLSQDTAFPFAAFQLIQQAQRTVSNSIESVVDAIFLKPLKCKREKVWEDTCAYLKKHYKNDHLNRAIEEVSTWSIIEMKKFMALCLYVGRTVKIHNTGFCLDDLDKYSQKRYIVCRGFLYTYYPESDETSLLSEGERHLHFWGYSELFNNERKVQLRRGIEPNQAVKEYLDRESV